MNRNNMALIGVVVFLVLGLGLTAFLLMNRGTAPAPGQEVVAPPPRKVWVARQDILPRTVIKPGMLMEDTASTDTAGAISDPNQVMGKMAGTTIYKGQAVTAAMTTEPLRRVVPANISIPTEDLRAVAVWVDPLQTAAGLVDKGDRVDVIVAHKLKVKGAGGQDGEVVAGRTIAQDLEVLAVDRSLAAGAAPTPPPGGAPGAPGAAPPPPPPPPPPPNQPGQKTFTRVVLAAPPEIAERLIAGNLSGELHLTIRDPRVRDNSLIAEVREYPVQTADPLAQKIREASVQDAIEARRKRRDLAFSLETQERTARLTKRLNPPIPMPTFVNPMSPGGFPTPAPEVHEITVVRGTEKTRVVVPR